MIKADPPAIGLDGPNTYDRGVWKADARAGPLTRRELQVLQLTSRGLTNSEIAAQLSLSIHGVKFHLSSIYRKLGVANRTEAAVAYMETSTPLQSNLV
jgi:DNA-binding CsgD family transcriptional regulator